MDHVLTIRAYERKPELGGGFRAVVVRHADKQRFESDVLPDRESAMYWAQSQAHEMMVGRPYRRASLAKRFRRGVYEASIWA